MKDALMGLGVGVAISIAIFLFDYLMLRNLAAERAKRQHKNVVEFDQTEKSRITALGRFCAVLPFGFAFLFWLIG